MLDNVGSFKGMAILPEGAADDLDLATEANGTGPFELESSAAGGITLSAFEDHWSGAPSVSGVEIRFISEPTTALTALATGATHWTHHVPPHPVDTRAHAGDTVGAPGPRG